MKNSSYINKSMAMQRSRNKGKSNGVTTKGLGGAQSLHRSFESHTTQQNSSN